VAILFRRSNGIYYHVSSQNGRRIWRSQASELEVRQTRISETLL